MAKYLVDSFEKNVELFDLQKNPLPMCDGDDCYDLPEVLDFREKVKDALRQDIRVSVCRRWEKQLHVRNVSRKFADA